MDEKHNIILAVMAAGGSGARFGPAQIQKLLFLIDREIPNYIHGPIFDFQPYDYGPFDRLVYTKLDELSIFGDVSIDQSSRYRTYQLTEQGIEKGKELLDEIDASGKEYIEKVSQWVRSVSFQQLVSAIYAQYPEMKVNSVFNN